MGEPPQEAQAGIICMDIAFLSFGTIRAARFLGNQWKGRASSRAPVARSFQINHRGQALSGPRTYPRRLAPCLMIVNAVITCIAYG
jgi:hypothetical protein